MGALTVRQKRSLIENALLIGAVACAAVASVGMLAANQPVSILLLIPALWMAWAAGYWRAM